MISKVFMWLCSFSIWGIILSYNTLVAIMFFLFLIVVLAWLLIFLQVEYIAYLLMLVYINGVLVFLLFSGMMLNFNFTLKSTKNASFVYNNNVFFFIFLFKCWMCSLALIERFCLVCYSVRFDYTASYIDVYGVASRLPYDEETFVFTTLYTDKVLIFIIIGLLLFFGVYGALLLLSKRWN